MTQKLHGIASGIVSKRESKSYPNLMLGPAAFLARLIRPHAQEHARANRIASGALTFVLSSFGVLELE